MSDKIKNIFITLGSQKFQFNRLLKEMDKFAASHPEYTIFAQAGESEYVPENFPSEHFVDTHRFNEEVDKADLIITHGGTGAIVGALKKGKRIVAVPRKEKYREHVDDHQEQIIRVFEKSGYICACYETEDLEKAIKKASRFTPRVYVSNRDHFIEFLGKTIEDLLI